MAQSLEELIYCRLPEGMDGYGGYKADILVDNLSEREVNLFVCRICHGIKREACFWEHGEEPGVGMHNEGIKEEIDSIKVSCPLGIQGGCEWTGKISEFRLHVNACYGNERPNKPIRDNKQNDISSLKALLFLLCFCLIPGVCISVSTGVLAHFFLMPGVEQLEQSITRIVLTKDLESMERMKNSMDDLKKKEETISKLLLSKFESYVSHNNEKTSLLVNSLNEQISKIRTELVTSENQHALFADVKIFQVQSEIDSLRTAIDLISKWALNQSAITRTSVMAILLSLDEIQFNPYFPQRGVIWVIYTIDSILESPVEISGPAFFVKEYKFQPIVESLREEKRCLTFCITLVNCDHYDKLKWPIELEENGFQVVIHTNLNSTVRKLEFEVNEDNRNYFKKPLNEKNKPLCKEWICKQELMKFVVDNQLEVRIRNTKLN